MENHYAKISISEVKPGQIILHPIYRYDGLLFLNRYKKFTTSVIDRLKQIFPKNFPILIAENENELTEFLNEKIYQSEIFLQDIQNLSRIHQQFIGVPLNLEMFIDERVKFLAQQQHRHEENSSKPYRIFQLPFWHSFESLLDSARLQERAKNIKDLLIKRLEEDANLLSMIERIKQYHDALYIHSLNSTCLSILIGLILELEDEVLLDLAISALFADIGFTEIPISQYIQYLDYGMHKEQIIPEHIKHSLRIIANVSSLHKKNIMFGILDHHEEFGGTGRPQGKKGTNISLFGRILAIAQGYDTSLGGYMREANMDVLETLQNLWKYKGNIFDPMILQVFFYRTAFNKVGKPFTYIGQEATIIGFTNFVEEPLLPKIRLKNNEIVDLYLKKET